MNSQPTSPDPMKELMEYILYSDIEPDTKGGIMERLDPVIEIMHHHQLTNTKPVSKITVEDLTGF